MTDRTRTELADLFKAFAPFSLALVLAAMSLTPLGTATAGYAVPHMTLMLVYYYSIHRPELLPMWAVAIIGFVQDLMWGCPPGLNVLVLLITQAVLINQQSLFTRRSFAVGWAGFVAVAAVALPTSWAIASLYAGTALPVWPMAVHALATVTAYPLFGWFFGRFRQVVLD